MATLASLTVSVAISSMSPLDAHGWLNWIAVPGVCREAQICFLAMISKCKSSFHGFGE